MGHDDDPFIDFCQALLFLSSQVPENSFGDIFHIKEPLPDILIINLIKELFDILDCARTAPAN